ncbi:hypothetical protein [Clostridium omnivorum]|uniref:Uncharacterized protein n=1 Tax=Clostridium omnivorum TaxID=1604902 RepID=A0ABQ5N9D0_9CLOT|nr:hypothetical protein [Clostridium sp. E14]GLC31702.1 hypothetical protein bsdE14_31120 [Clostridium sp. E14]
MNGINSFEVINGYMSYAKDLISSEISYNIGRFFDLDNNDISGIKNNIDSIIYNRLNNITITTWLMLLLNTKLLVNIQGALLMQLYHTIY